MSAIPALLDIVTDSVQQRLQEQLYLRMGAEIQIALTGTRFSLRSRELTFRFLKNNPQRMILTLSAEVDFYDVRASTQIRQNLSFEELNYLPTDKYPAAVLNQVDETLLVMSGVIRNRVRNLDLTKQFMCSVLMRNPQWEITAQLQKMRFLEETGYAPESLTDRLTKTRVPEWIEMVKKSAAERFPRQEDAPEGLISGKPESCKISLELSESFSLSLNLRLTIRYEHTRTLRRNVPVCSLPELIYDGAADRMHARVSQMAEDALRRMVKTMMKSVPFYEVKDLPPHLRGTREGDLLKQLLKTGRAQVGAVEFRLATDEGAPEAGSWDGMFPCYGRGLIRMYDPAQMYRGASLAYPFHWNPNPPDNDLISVIRTLLSSVDRFSIMPDPDDPDPVILIHPTTVSIPGYSDPGPVIYRDVPRACKRGWVDTLLYICQERRMRRRREYALQMTALGSLNELQTAILRRIYQGEPDPENPAQTRPVQVTRSEIRVLSRKFPDFTDVAAMRALDLLKQPLLPVQEVMQPLVCVEQGPGSDIGFELYVPNPHVPKELIMSFQPRELDRRDLAEMYPQAQLQWVLKQTEAAALPGAAVRSSEILSLLENDLSRTALADFVCSETGERFLKDLIGPDRKRAREFFESLPDCREQARPLLAGDPEPPEQAPDSTTDNNPDAASDSNPDSNSENTLGTTPSSNSNSSPDTTPESTPESTPDKSPDGAPEITPDNSPNTTADRTPENTPDNNPNTTADSSPDTSPDSAPDDSPDTSPDSAPDTTPENAPDSTPDNAPENAPDNHPNTTADSNPDSTVDNIQDSSPEPSEAPAQPGPEDAEPSSQDGT